MNKYTRINHKSIFCFQNSMDNMMMMIRYHLSNNFNDNLLTCCIVALMISETICVCKMWNQLLLLHKFHCFIFCCMITEPKPHNLNDTQNWSGHGLAREISRAKEVSVVTFCVGILWLFFSQPDFKKYEYFT